MAIGNKKNQRSSFAKIIGFVLLSAAWPGWGFADAIDKNDFVPGITNYEPSYFGWETLGEARAQFLVSLQYPIMPFEMFGIERELDFVGYRSGMYMVYTGRYDFYLRRDSAPVVSREQNPGAYFAFHHCFGKPLTLNLGYFHLSNGQVIETLEEYQSVPDYPQDSVSRGWDYILLSGSYEFELPGLDSFFEHSVFAFESSWFTWEPEVDCTRLTLTLEGRGFLNKQGFGALWKEEQIFWTPVFQQPKRSDYDGIRIGFILQNGHFRLSETIRSGYTGLHFSSDTSFSFRIRKWLPIAIHYYNGYGPDLSTYHIWSQSLILSFDLYNYQPESRESVNDE